MPPASDKNGLLPRMATWDVLKTVAAGAYADVALERVLKNYQLTVVNRKLVMELSYGAIKQRYLLDCWIDYFGKVPIRKQPPNLRWLLHIGLYQILYMDRIPPAAAINTTVELAKEKKIAGLAPVVNGLLRTALRAKNSGKDIPLPESGAERLAQTQSIPLWFAQELICWEGKEMAEKIAQASNQNPPLDIRVNRLFMNPEVLKERFESVGIKSIPIKNCPFGLQVISGSGDIRDWPGYDEGFWSVQDRASQRVVPLLAPRPGERILDACSAPGGKATHIAEVMKNNGEIWAVDRSKERLNRVVLNASRLRCTSLNILVADSCALLKEKPNWERFFHRILIDAPCSGLGTLARHPDARWRMSPDKVEELVSLQFELLDGLLPLLRPGGQIVYSTCTIHPRENGHQIGQFLSRHPELSLKKDNQLWPDYQNTGDGFYTALMELIE